MGRTGLSRNLSRNWLQPGLGPRNFSSADSRRLNFANIARAQPGAIAPIGVPIGAVTHARLAGAARRFPALAILELIGNVLICWQ